MRIHHALPLAAAFALAPALAHADDIAVEVTQRVLAGQGRPAVILFANKAVAQATATLKRDGGESITLRSGTIPPGSKKQMFFDAPVGTSHFEGTLEVQFLDGTGGAMPVAFDVLVSKGLELAWLDEKLDLKGGSAWLTLSGPADKCEYDVAYDGKPNRHGWIRFAGEAPGTPLQISWPPYDGDPVVLKVSVTCHDRDGFFRQAAKYPWRVSIPHEDVIFETGKSEVRASEAPKLDKAIGEIRTALRRYGKVLTEIERKEIRVYVGGHTDTVGDNASNRALSLARAKAIAGYFRSKGLDVPIYFAGFGEDAPAVETPDETDEPRNRRAEYQISLEHPVKASWTKL